MRPAVVEFARDVAASFPIDSPLIEVGARAAEGQEGIADMRAIFDAAIHVGCDIQEGLGVDRVEDVHNLSFDDNSVGTLISLETLEHVADPLRAVREMHRVLKPGGLLAISSLMFFPIHAHPWDYWRFTPEGFELLLEPFESKLVVAQGWEFMPEGVFGVAVKGPAELSPGQLPRTMNIARHWDGGKRVELGPLRLSLRELWKLTLKHSVAALSDRARGLGATRR
ncbi:MAG: class I SAM-dependent methyltransferase [Acidimicrobiales bacterium]